MIECFKDVGLKWKENIKGVCKRVATIDVNDVINLRQDLRDDIMKTLRKDSEIEYEVLRCNWINDVSYLTLEIKKWCKRRMFTIFLITMRFFAHFTDIELKDAR
jgi:hypothetical protein